MTLAGHQHIKKSGIQRELNVKRPAIWTSPDCIVSINPPPFAACAGHRIFWSGAARHGGIKPEARARPKIEVGRAVQAGCSIASPMSFAVSS